MNRTVHIQGEPHTHADFQRAVGYASEWAYGSYGVVHIHMGKENIVACYWRSTDDFQKNTRPAYVMVAEVEQDRYVFRS
jgi:hypothetical protein